MGRRANVTGTLPILRDYGPGKAKIHGYPGSFAVWAVTNALCASDGHRRTVYSKPDGSEWICNVKNTWHYGQIREVADDAVFYGHSKFELVVVHKFAFEDQVLKYPLDTKLSFTVDRLIENMLGRGQTVWVSDGYATRLVKGKPVETFKIPVWLQRVGMWIATHNVYTSQEWLEVM